MVTDTLNRHAPIETKYLRANDGPFMTKALRKAMMHRKRLRNKYIKRRTEENLKAFKKQRNFCMKLLRQWRTQGGEWGGPDPPTFQKVGHRDSQENVIKLVGGGVGQICQEVVSEILEKQAKNCFSRVGSKVLVS